MLGNTPMMKQYEEIKSQYQDCLLFYRLGDFYEMFGPDAETGSRVLGITLTARDGGLGKVPMCGVPFHSAESYIAKAIRAGYKVGICEQVEDPKSVKGIVKREVIRVISPGTMLEDSYLQGRTSNYLVSITKGETGYGFAIVDASTGEFMATEIPDWHMLHNEFWRYDPVECLISADDEVLLEEINRIAGENRVTITTHSAHAFVYRNAEKMILEHFHINALNSLGCEDKPMLVCAAGAVLDYLNLMQKSRPDNIMALKVYSLKETMDLDYATRRNLELVRSLHGGDKKDSVLGVIDYTRTALGGRMLKSWIEKPLLDKEQIQMRLDSTEEMVNNTTLRLQLKDELEPVYDLERIVSRITYGTANAKDLLALKHSLAYMPKLESSLQMGKTAYITQLSKDFDPLTDIYELLERSIHPEAPFSVREGNLIRDGFHEEVDSLRDIMQNGKQWIVELELRERERTGLKLKVSYNKVFGYYIDVPRSKSDAVPEDYIRKQTLANSERYITPELKELESRVLGADEKFKELEYQLFVQVRNQVSDQVERILRTAHVIAQLDCLYSLGQAAVYRNFCKPVISENGQYRLKECRHPVVEDKLKDGWFIPNDVYFHPDNERFLIITGPNMAGKSTYCRSVAVASILMQIGSFVPAREAILPVVDRVFARIGASDDLSTGQSTFMVEMNEVANIVNNATKDSLIILDEVGRGTSTYDGLAIAWALTDYINNTVRAKTMFATHYHELTALEEQPGICNYSVAVKEDGDKITFLRKIIPGGADRSYGIHVASLAGIPEQILQNAKSILRTLELEKAQHRPQTEQITLFAQEEPIQTVEVVNRIPEVVEELAAVNVNNLTPMDAMNLLFQLQKKAQEVVAHGLD